MYTIYAYIAYLAVSTGLTVWVARTLSKNGRIFLVDAFTGNEALADSVNHLLVVGFYLINIGYVTLALSYGTKPNDTQAAIEFLSWKVGLVLVVLGFMHFFNLAVFTEMRKKGTVKKHAHNGFATGPEVDSQVHGTLEAFATVKPERMKMGSDTFE